MSFDKEKIDNFVSGLKEYFSEAPSNNYEATIKCLEKLVAEYGTDSYDFNYITDQLVELYLYKIQGVLPQIVDDLISKTEGMNYNEEIAKVAFAAYYSLSLIYKKNNNIDELAKLMGDAYLLVLQRFPLIFEVRARYHKRIGDYKNALKSDQQSISILENMNVINPAVLVSFASTVAMVYESGNSALLRNESYIDKALGYIECAINFNPTYPKYHFIKGKLIYYKNVNNLNFKEFTASCEQAKICINEAKKKLDRSTAHYIKEFDLFEDFITLIDNDIEDRIENKDTSEVFVNLSVNDVRVMKEKILLSMKPIECRPEVPKKKIGQKYIFISYSTQDYKSVYCDLIELYARKIPFDYDKNLTHGEGWESQIKEKINKDDCIGILFYLSTNTVLSDAIEKEIEFVNKKFNSRDEFKKHCFYINLESGFKPSEILIKALQDNEMTNLQAKGVNAKRLMTYLNTFEDELVFTEKEDKPDSDKHFDEYIDSIKNKFPELFNAIEDKK